MFDRRESETFDQIIYRRKRKNAYERSAEGRANNRARVWRYRQNRVIDRERKFMAWDGEGTGHGTDHKYVLLMNGTVADEDINYMSNVEGLSTYECFNYMCQVAKELPGYTHVIFAGGYDINMMLKDIPFNALERLHKTGRLYWKNFRLEYHPRKSLEISRYKPEIFIHKVRKRPEATITLWDVFSFFQGSFISALDDFFTEEEKKELGYDIIAKEKARRDKFTLEELETIIAPYTKLEIKALVRLMDRLYNEYCLGAGIVLERFDGSGAIAQSVLKRMNVKKHYPPEGSIPPKLELASQHAYGGADIQIMRYGHHEGDIWVDDIVSAYPSETAELPELALGRWSHVTTSKQINHDKPFSLYHVIWDYREYPVAPFYPFFYRSWPDGAISYPIYGRNWVWYPELAAALKWRDKLPGKIYVLESWQYTPGSDIKPFAFIHDMFKERQRLKSLGHGMQLVYKLAYNSFYGKLVQHLGYEEHLMRGEKKWRPPFFCMPYGGYITSAIRAKLFGAAMQHPSSIVAFATDGIFTTVPLDLDIGKGLGQWEEKKLTSGTFVQSGVYWTHEPATSKTKAPCPQHGSSCEMTQHFRGFDRENLHEEDVLKAWSEGREKLPVECTRFITLGQGLALTDKTLWHTWHTSDRELDLHPIRMHNKRQPIEGIDETPHLGLVPTYPNSLKVPYDKRGLPILSEPYPLPWTKERTQYDDYRKEQILRRWDEEAVEERYW